MFTPGCYSTLPWGEFRLKKNRVLKSGGYFPGYYATRGIKWEHKRSHRGWMMIPAHRVFGGATVQRLLGAHGIVFFSGLAKFRLVPA